MPRPDHSPIMVTIAPDRRRLILERLQSHFYSENEPGERIATAVLAALRDLDESPSLPR